MATQQKYYGSQSEDPAAFQPPYGAENATWPQNAKKGRNINTFQNDITSGGKQNRSVGGCRRAV
jgi:hypothetical protein